MIVALGEDDYGNEDAMYAIVEESENLGDENYVKFVGQDEMEAKDINLLDEGWLVAYKTSSSKVSEVQKLIDVENINKASDVKKVYDYLYASATEERCPNADDTTAVTCTHCTLTTAYVAAHCGCTDGSNHTVQGDCSNWVDATNAVHGTVPGVEDIFFALTTPTAPTGTKFVNNIDTTTKLEAIVLDEVEIKASGKITLKYVETGDNDVAIDSVKLDKDLVKVYDLRNGEVEKTDIDTLAEEVNVNNDDVYVIVAVNGDYDADGANVVFIVK